MLLLLLLSGLLALSLTLNLASPAAGQASAWEWQNPLPQGNSLYSVWGSSSSDVFAVGLYGTILHYDGASWKRMLNGTSADLSDVWGSSGSDVFAVGGDRSGIVILHYDGATWTSMSSGVDGYLTSVWGSSGSDVFAVGYNGMILHYDGNAWTAMSSGTNAELRSVWGSSSSDVFAVGYTDIQITVGPSQYKAKILHYDGHAWTTILTLETSSEYYGPVLYDVWGSSGSDVFAVGSIVRPGLCRDCSPSSEGKIWHYDGHTWTLVWDSGGDEGPYPQDVWGSNGSDVFVLASGGVILHYDGSTWTPSGTSSALRSIWGSSGNDVFTVGSGGVILHYDGTTWSAMNSGMHTSLADVWGSSGSDVFTVGSGGAILHYDGTTWTFMPSGTTGVFRSVWGSSGSDVFAVGSGGTILHYDGTTWSAMNSGTANGLHGVWGSSNSDVFAVGEQGTILHYAGTTWTPMPSGTSTWLSGVWGSSGSDVFAVGSGGTILHYDGSTWTPMPSGTSNRPSSVWGSSGSDVFAVGEYGTILHYDGATWTPMPSGTSTWLSSVWGNSGSDVFAVSGDNTILHYNGSTWIRMRSGAGNNYLYSVWGNSGSDVFAVGDNGVILHYSGNTVPVATGDLYTTTEDTTLDVATPGVLGNDSDANTDNLTITGNTLPQSGALTWNGDGAFTYQPATNFCGQDHFSYSLSDRMGGAATATVTLEVACVNDPPVAGDDEYATSEDNVLDMAAPGVLGNDSDADQDSLTVISSGPPGTGTLMLPVFGTLTLNEDGGFRYQPMANFCGEDRYAYSVRDSYGSVATAQLAIHVTCVNDPPSLGAITGLPNLAPVGATISVTVPFTDPDRGDTFTAIWDWGDGTTSPGGVDTTAQLVTGSHPGYEVGVYSVRLVLFDQAGARSNEVAAEVVVAVIQPLYLPLVVMNQAAVYAAEVTAEGVLAAGNPLYLPLVLR